LIVLLLCLEVRGQKERLSPSLSGFAGNWRPAAAGVLVFMDSRTGQETGYRADERFPMCSIFKWLLAATVLGRVDAGKESLGRALSGFRKDDLLEYSPVIGHFADGPGITIARLCEAGVTVNDYGCEPAAGYAERP